MAIKSFKDILDNKGYRISSKDRAIFEEGTLQSFFGFTDSDMIEFILYDVNDNQLPQGEYGENVRYIPMNSDNIKDYFLVADGTKLQAFQFPNEYFIDAERLINEAGYDNGIFKTQITLLNKRIGLNSTNEKMWIKEISPSRTEVKLLPLRNDIADKTDLLQRFGIFVDGKEFREAMFNEFSNRYSSINDNNYGNPKGTPLSITFSKQDVYTVAQRIIVECIEFYLPKRTIQTESEMDIIFDESVDKVGKILQRRESDVVINATTPNITVTKRKTDTDNSSIKDYELSEEIKKEIPNNKAIPKFSKPNPTKSTKISKDKIGFGRATNIKKPTNNSNTYNQGGGGISSDS